jgi:peptide/nickel transport system substrate-binding protein
MQSMDWQTLVSPRARKDSPAQGGWNIFMTVWASVDGMNAISMNAVNAGCDKAWFGWPCDQELERLRDAFARSDDEQERKKLAEQIQLRAMDIGTHVPVGEYQIPVAARRNLKSFVTGYFLVAWGIEKP